MDRRTLLASGSAGLAALGLMRFAYAKGPQDFSLPSLGMNLTQVCYYTPSPFIDRIRTASGEWYFQGVAGPPPVGPAGLPTSMAGAAIVQMMVSLDPVTGGKSALYELTYDGEATFELQYAQILSSRRGKVVFRFSGPRMPVALIYRSVGSSPPTRLSLVRQDHAALFAAGEIFTPEFLQQVSGFDTLRFMDWLQTNGSTVTDALPQVSALTYAKGVPLDIVIALANKTGANPWVTIPHLATDALVMDIIGKLKAGLHPGIVPPIEYSNEVWNLSFPQSRYAAAQAAARWAAGTPGAVYYGFRSGEIAKLARGSGARVALGCQTVSPHLSELIWKGVALSGATNRDFADWIIATYVNGTLTQASGPTLALMAANDVSGALDNILNASGQGALSVETMTAIYRAHGAIASTHGLRLAAYEGNLHLNALPSFGPQRDDVTAFFTKIYQDPGSVTVMGANLDAFTAAGGKLACLYNLGSAASPWGIFGLVDTPSWPFLREHLNRPAAPSKG
jgi:hypothetical protein